MSREGENLMVPTALMDGIYLHLFDNDPDDIRFSNLIKKETSDKGITYYASQKFNTLPVLKLLSFKGMVTRSKAEKTYVLEHGNQMEIKSAGYPQKCFSAMASRVCQS